MYINASKISAFFVFLCGCSQIKVLWWSKAVLELAARIVPNSVLMVFRGGGRRRRFTRVKGPALLTKYIQCLTVVSLLRLWSKRLDRGNAPHCGLIWNYWAAKQQTSWIIALWWFCVSLWRICITFVSPSNSQKLRAPSSRSECHFHFASIDPCNCPSVQRCHVI